MVMKYRSALPRWRLFWLDHAKPNGTNSAMLATMSGIPVANTLKFRAFFNSENTSAGGENSKGKKEP